MALKRLRTTIDVNSQPLYTDSVGDRNFLVLVAATNKALTVPTGSKYAQILCSTISYVKESSMGVTVPVADDVAGAAALMLVPNVFYLVELEGFGNPASLNFIAAGTPTIMVQFYN